MRLKYAITIGDPKSAQIVAYQARSTGNSHLTRDDIVISLGLTQSRCRAGLSLIYAKYTKDQSSADMAMQELVRYSENLVMPYHSNLGAAKLKPALRTLSILALEEYCRTADTPGAKCLCGGVGEVKDVRQSKKYGHVVMKKCSRCKGSGLKPLTETRCHHALVKIISMSQSTYSRWWSPVYRQLLNWCYQQERAAEAVYNVITLLNPACAEANEEGAP